MDIKVEDIKLKKYLEGYWWIFPDGWMASVSFYPKREQALEFYKRHIRQISVDCIEKHIVLDTTTVDL